MSTSVPCPYAIHARLLFMFSILSNIKSDYEILKGFFHSHRTAFCPCFDFWSECVCVCVSKWAQNVYVWLVNRERNSFVIIVHSTENSTEHMNWLHKAFFYSLPTFNDQMTWIFLLFSSSNRVYCSVHSIGHTVNSYFIIIIIKLKWKE